MSATAFYRLLALMLAGAALLWLGSGFIQTAFFAERTARAVTARGELASFETTAADVFQSTAPSVAYIFTEVAQPSLFGRSVRQGTGSGFVWDQAGHVITNSHVVEGADRVFVRLDAGAVASARVIGRSSDHDIAVLRITEPAARLHPIAIGSSQDLRIGQTVFAIGNPFGLSRTMTSGIVSALGRTLPNENGRDLQDLIQTDAAINPGNSGGPLLDSAGRLIGINTAIISQTGSYAGIGFAVPIETVNRVVPQLITRGRTSRPGIGVSVAAEELASQLGVRGVVVIAVSPGSPAARAGLTGVDARTQRIGDVIVAVDGEPVNTAAELSRRLEQIGIGSPATLTVERAGSRRQVQVEVADVG